MKISEDKYNPFEAKQMAMKCDACGKLAFVDFPYKPTAWQRMQIVKAALDEHRKVCAVANSEIQRTYELWYPRKGW